MSLVGTSSSFWLYRLVLRDKLEEWVASKGPVVSGIRQDLEKQVIGFGFCIRFCPIPLWLQNALMAVIFHQIPYRKDKQTDLRERERERDTYRKF